MPPKNRPNSGCGLEIAQARRERLGDVLPDDPADLGSRRASGLARPDRAASARRLPSQGASGPGDRRSRRESSGCATWRSPLARAEFAAEGRAAHRSWPARSAPRSARSRHAAAASARRRQPAVSVSPRSEPPQNGMSSSRSLRRAAAAGRRGAALLHRRGAAEVAAAAAAAEPPSWPARHTRLRRRRRPGRGRRAASARRGSAAARPRWSAAPAPVLSVNLRVWSWPSR